MIKKTLQKIKVYTACVMCACMLLSLAGCTLGKEEEPKTTEAKIDKTLTDADGFITVKDYVQTVSDDVRIRRAPNESADVYITLSKGVDLTRTGIKDEWTRVMLNGSSFYVQSKYVTETSIKWATESTATRESHIIYIDPAKQMTEDNLLEAVSPEIAAQDDTPIEASASNATKAGLKARMAPASVGIYTGAYEYDITLAVANYLNAELVKRGYTVYLSRSTSNVNISNAKRTQMSNASGAELYIKLQATSTKDTKAKGVLGFIATSTNSHTGTMYQKNYELCYDLLREICEETGADRMGIYETDDMTSLNYSDIPATVINMGFLSNENDDVRLNTEEYQKKLAMGFADGIDLYFEEISK